jgi:molybdate transport system substrate-binding protein
MFNRWFLTLGFTLSLAFFAFPALAGKIGISAASSLTEAVNEICTQYGAKHQDVNLVRNFASSGTLANQISNGAPADLFISANPKWMDYLVERGRISRGRVQDLATNTLVVVGPKDGRIDSLAALTKFSRIAIGSPQSVPAGEYAEKALIAAGVYEQLQGENRLVIAKDARQALMYAERGEVDAAFVYRTDALLARKAVILYEVPFELYPPVTYPVGLTSDGVKNNDAAAFFVYLKSAEAAMVLEKYGFVAVMRHDSL